MPWTETTPVDERLMLVTDAQSDRFTMAEVCARYGVSRRVGYKWVHRYAEGGRRGLADRSRAPHHSPRAIAPEVAELLCALRTAHPHWGARKLLRILRTRPAGHALADREHGGRSPRAPRLGAPAPNATAHVAPGRDRTPASHYEPSPRAYPGGSPCPRIRATSS